MSRHYHAVVWINYREARIFRFGPADIETFVLHPDNPTRHIRHKANPIVIGPANAKAEPIKHIHHLAPKLMNLIAGVEAVDHPSDGALVAFARHYFKADDRMC